MQSVRLAVEHTVETVHPMHAFVCESPAVDREVLLGGDAVDGSRTLVFYVEGEAEAYEAVLADQPDVAAYTVHPESDDAFYLYVRARNREVDDVLLDAFDREAVVVVPPIEFRPNRRMVLTLVGAPDAIDAAVESLPDGVGVEVLAVGTEPGMVGAGVTDRQREALGVAWEAGYYDVPRTGGIEDVAGALDCAVSTASTLLRRAESTLVAATLGVDGSERY